MATATTIIPGQTLNILGNRVTFQVTGEQTGGAYSLVEYVAPAGYPGPAPHIHEHFEEVYFVLEGSLTFLHGEATLVKGAGEGCFIERGKVHTFSNPGTAPARFLVLISPAGFEGYFKAVYDLVSSQTGPLDMTKILPEMERLSIQYDSIPVAADLRYNR